MAKTFDAPLQTSIVPAIAAGSSTPTFTRATAATIIDHEGIVRTAISGEARFYGARRVENLCEYSDDITKLGNAAGTTPPTIGTASFGGRVCEAITFPSGTGSYSDSRREGGTVGQQGCTRTFSWRITDLNAAFASLKVGLSRALVGGESLKVIVTGAAAWNDQPVIDSSNSSTYTGGLVRFGFVSEFPSTASGEVGFYISPNSTLSSDITVYIAEMQIEYVPSSSYAAPSEYVSSGLLSAPYHGANVDGVRYFATENGNSVASNVVTEATGDAIASDTLRGYLSEGQRTNRCLYSEDFTNAAWVKTACTISADSTAAPNGATTADTLTATGPNATVVQDLGVVGSAKKTGSIYLKRKTGTGNIDLTMDGGAGWTTVAVTSSWTRFDLSQTLANEDFGIRIVTSGDEVYAWGAQVEQDAVSGTISWASSYIPTTTAAVTRNRDQLGFAQAGNISALNGTSFCEFYAYSDTRYNSRAIGSDNNSQLTINGLVSIYDGVNSSVAWPATDTILKGASTWADGGNKQAFCNGGGSTPNAFSGFTIPALYIGGTGNDQSASTPIRNIRIWDRVMDVDANGNVISAGGVWRRRGLRAR